MAHRGGRVPVRARRPVRVRPGGRERGASRRGAAGGGRADSRAGDGAARGRPPHDGGGGGAPQRLAPRAGARGRRGRAEEPLNDSSRGKAIETEKALIERLERELKDEPGALQKRILEKGRKRAEKAEKKEKDAAEKLGEIIKKAKT